MSNEAISDAKRKVIDLLKRRGPATTAQLARLLGLTDVAIRQHLLSLETAGLATQRKLPAQGRGRPSVEWSLADPSASLFPDRHGELTSGLIEAMRQTFGQRGLQRVLRSRADAQVKQYRAIMPAAANASLKARVAALALERSREGYMAEVVTERRDRYLLIEHHCPICEAATYCQDLCGTELEVFQRTLGVDALVERTAHLLSGDGRCVYRITKTP